jgi:hypothetical protein
MPGPVHAFLADTFTVGTVDRFSGPGVTVGAAFGVSAGAVWVAVAVGFQDLPQGGVDLQWDSLLPSLGHFVQDLRKNLYVNQFA